MQRLLKASSMQFFALLTHAPNSLHDTLCIDSHAESTPLPKRNVHPILFCFSAKGNHTFQLANALPVQYSIQ